MAKSGQEALGTVADQVGSKTSEDDRTERSFETPRLGMKLAKVGTNNATNTTGKGLHDTHRIRNEYARAVSLTDNNIFMQA